MVKGCHNYPSLLHKKNLVQNVIYEQNEDDNVNKTLPHMSVQKKLENTHKQDNHQLNYQLDLNKYSF